MLDCYSSSKAKKKSVPWAHEIYPKLGYLMLNFGLMKQDISSKMVIRELYVGQDETLDRINHII